MARINDHYLKLAAGYLFPEIGRRVRERGARAWDTRTVIPTNRKLWVMGVGVSKVFGTLSQRVSSPWKPAPISTVWHHPKSELSAVEVRVA